MYDKYGAFMTNPAPQRDDLASGTLKAAASSTATSIVADELVRMIIGRFVPGDSLPSEAELALVHGVSRVTVREAVKMVAGRGLLELARGRRAIVREPGSSALGQFIGWIVQTEPNGVFDLVEARMSLEVQAAGLAARRGTPPSLAPIAAELDRMKALGNDMNPNWTEESEGIFHHADVAFHRAIAVAGGNRILIAMFDAMADTLEKSFYLSRKGRRARGQTVEDTVHSHQRIFDSIRVADAAGAEAAMRVHLMDSFRDMQAAQKARP
jgi:DNA-binding FadR family transcriptional regulator